MTKVAVFVVAPADKEHYSIYGSGEVVMSEEMVGAVGGMIRISEWVEVQFTLLGELDAKAQEQYIAELDKSLEKIKQRRDAAVAGLEKLRESHANSVSQPPDSL